MQQGDFSKEVEQLLNPVRDKKCLLGIVHATLEGVDADSLTALLASPVSNSKISELLQKNGHPVGETAVWKHRRNKCACVRVQ